VQDAGFAGGLRESLLAAIAGEAVRVGDRYGVKRNLLERLISRISYAIVRLLIGLLGYSRSI